MKTALYILLAWSSIVIAAQNPKAPKWPDCYSAKAILRLPYAEIEEPLTAYYEGAKNRSRIDYYDVMQTYQIGGNGVDDFGHSYKVAPMTTEKFLNEMHCFVVDGVSLDPVKPQTILPDISAFNLTGTEALEGVECNVWRSVVKEGGKRNVYTLWQSVATQLPVRYELMGYDNLLGSHYDKYYIDYVHIDVEKSLDDAVFKTPPNLQCGPFPGPGSGSEHHISMNPMHEFIHRADDHVEDAFERFKRAHSKNYRDKATHEKRKHNFRHNLRFVNSKNRAGLTYRLAVNHLADLNDAEMKMMRGRKRSSGYNGGLPFNKNAYNVRDIPDQIDWRLYGAVSQVKDQAVCGSCWSFGTVGAVEGAFFLKTKQLVRLSQQELMDCSWGEGNNACDGGEDFRAYHWIMKHGLASEEDYGPYLAVDGYCKVKNVSATAQMTGFVNVTAGDLDALKAAIAAHGPVSVSIDASHRSLSFYANGVYYEPNCGSGPDELDHSVLAVGYGMLGQPYWLVKNSWSTYWGNNGYVLMSQKDNNCGVATSPTYVVM